MAIAIAESEKVIVQKLLVSIRFRMLALLDTITEDAQKAAADPQAPEYVGYLTLAALEHTLRETLKIHEVEFGANPQFQAAYRTVTAVAEEVA